MGLLFDEYEVGFGTGRRSAIKIRLVDANRGASQPQPYTKSQEESSLTIHTFKNRRTHDRMAVRVDSSVEGSERDFED